MRRPPKPRKNGVTGEPLKRGDVRGELLSSEQYVVYTTSGLSAIGKDGAGAQKSLEGNEESFPDKKKPNLTNPTENAAHLRLRDV